MAQKAQSQENRLSDSAPRPTFRSGAVARIAGMPVSTLRIWEHRYQAVAPSTAATGHRLYSSADVERVVLLRQLTEQGHAIGSLARLDIAQLKEVELTRAGVETNSGAEAPLRTAAMKIVVIGRSMARRLEHAAATRPWTAAPQVMGVFDSLADAARSGPGPTHASIDLLLCQATGLQESVLPELKSAREAWRAGSVAVSYRFASPAARRAWAHTGAVVNREPADEQALATWLQSLQNAVAAASDQRSQTTRSIAEPDAAAWSAAVLGLTETAAARRRFDDITLTDFAGLSSGIACACPSHIAELLIQIGGFEAYSADCAHRSPADAELHAYLQRVAGAARVLFETALERVVIADGLGYILNKEAAS